MTSYQVRQSADEFGIPYPSAVKMRLRYLYAQMILCCEWVEGGKLMPQVMLNEALDEISGLVVSLKRPVHGDVTPEMIEQARGVKIDSMVEFKRGKVECPFHEDKNPSAYHGTRTNRLVCPVCNETWDAISLQQHFSGQSFHEAVKTLCR